MALSKKTQAALEDAKRTQVIEGQVGLGVDIVEIDRMRKILKRTPSFAVRVFSENEQRYCNKTADPAVHYATRFAAKEAVVKALGCGFSQGISVRDIEVIRNEGARPTISLKGCAARIAQDMGVTEIPISLSYTHNDAIACAIAITRDSVEKAEERIDPTEELTKQFKEARTMLDELG